MRLLILADVHANWEALLSLQRAEPRPDAVLFAGDAVGYGPDPVNCVRWLRANTHLAVRGNHDEALQRTSGLAGVPPELTEAADETLADARQRLAADDQAALGGWPLAATATFGGADFHLVHGTPADPLNGRLNPATCPEAELQRLFEAVPGDVIVLGHSHLPALRKFGPAQRPRLIINPGSLGQPRYGVPDATYAVWEDGQVRIRHLHYDYHAPAHKLRLMPLSPEVAQQLAQVLETGAL